MGQLAVNSDDVVLQRPEDVRLLLDVFHTHNACCGAASAFLLRRIAYRAGAYAPGIQEGLFHELNVQRDGGTLEKVQRWFDGRVTSLHELGYRLQCRRLAMPTQSVIDWVKGGKGYRGAMLPTNFVKLHPKGSAGPDVLDDRVWHAVGVTVDRLDAKSDEDLVMIDPWPGNSGAKDRAPVVPAALESAQRDRNYHGLAFFWTGWS